MQLQEVHRWASNLAITFLCKRPGPFSYYPVYTKEELDEAPKWNFIIDLGTHAAAAAAKSLQSCPTLCNPVDGSPPGFAVPGIFQARTLEWVAISFSNA